MEAILGRPQNVLEAPRVLLLTVARSRIEEALYDDAESFRHEWSRLTAKRDQLLVWHARIDDIIKSEKSWIAKEKENLHARETMLEEGRDELEEKEVDMAARLEALAKNQAELDAARATLGEKRSKVCDRELKVGTRERAVTAREKEVEAR